MRGLASLILLLLICGSAAAQEDKKTDDLKPNDPDTGESTVQETTLGVLPNPFEKQGVKFAVTYIGELLGNPSGGAKRGEVYEDRFNFAADLDFEKLVGLQGLTFHANVFRIDGGGLSRGSLLNYLDVSGIEALPTTRLYEMWFEKKWNDDKIALRAGQLAADSEFATSKYTDVFTNASLGWPAIFALNMPSGGPSPPLAALGARFRSDVTENLTLVGAVFDGNAAGPGLDDPQLRNRYGINFRINDPPLTLYEAQFQWHAKKGDPSLAGKLKLGGWRHFGNFKDQRFDTSGLSLADPRTTGIPANFAGDYGLYAVFEQKLFRVGHDDERGIGVFARASYSPPAQNLIDYYADGGVEFIGLDEARPHDKLGISAAYAHVSPRAQALDRYFQAVYGPAWPVRTSEALLTAVYQYEVHAGVTLQPNFQFVRRPGGGATDPLSNVKGLRLKDASVFGLRTVLKF
ncbi:porin [Bradyrhizobium brasilense]|uniref:Porin n=2 Tax=Bradyrhizobium brasilense TaxID=1419277 RepID=A0A1G7Q967_9BRAD|nr:carbohydrate porin [Bradyrhizobium brasilense]MCC8975400.1 carbohydrate porin [Bradyrhizobium brasilense]SDF95081.1 porin [Bradyrhizobium brasilense]